MDAITAIIIDGTTVVLQSRRVRFRLWKRDGIIHAVWPTLHRLEDTSPRADTLCRQRIDVPWRNTSKFQSSKIDCMSCLVRMSRVVI